MPDSICMAMMFGLRRPAVDCATNALEPEEPSFSPRDLRHLATKVLNDSCTAMPRERPSASGLAPARLLRGELEHRLVARVLARSARRSWKRVLSWARDLVEEALVAKGRVCVEPTERHTAPAPIFGECSRPARFGIA